MELFCTTPGRELLHLVAHATARAVGHHPERDFASGFLCE
jgi:hypothetical protein